MHADLVEELLSREAAQGIKPDPDTDAYLRATIFGSKKNNLVVEMVIRLLGLHTCADTVVVSAYLYSACKFLVLEAHVLFQQRACESRCWYPDQMGPWEQYMDPGP